MAIHDAASLNLQGRSGRALYCAKRSMRTIHGVKACGIDSFHSGQMFQPPPRHWDLHSPPAEKENLRRKSFLVARRNGELLPYFQIDFQSRVQKGEIRRGCGEEIPREMSVAPRMTGVAYTNALIREFSLNI
jgi:hypothetical protein